MLMVKRILVTAYLLILFFVASTESLSSDQPQGKPTDIPKNEIQSSLFNPSLYVTPKSAIRNLKNEPGHTILVDVRRKDLFEKARIPGAINIPLYSIKTKTFLKNKPMLLLDEGYGSSQMQRTCVDLNAAGYHARILFGGIKLWWEAGGPVNGDFFYLNSLKTISPDIYYSSRNIGHWLVIDTSKKLSDAGPKTLPNVHHVPYENEKNVFAKALRSLSNTRKRDRFSSILVLSQDGKNYEKMEGDINTAQLSNVFYLDGGFDGYHHYLQNLAVLQKHEKGVKVIWEMRHMPMKRNIIILLAIFCIAIFIALLTMVNPQSLPHKKKRRTRLHHPQTNPIQLHLKKHHQSYHSQSGVVGLRTGTPDRHAEKRFHFNDA